MNEWMDLQRRWTYLRQYIYKLHHVLDTYIIFNFFADYFHSCLFQMTTAIAIEDVRREVKILRALTGHNNLVQFYDAYEDHDNVYVVME